MRKIILLLLTVFYTVGSFCQETALQPGTQLQNSRGSMQRAAHPGLDFPDYPQLRLSEKCRDIVLPAIADNSSQPYLRPVFSQKGASCGQSASVAYNFCYEINRLRNRPADTSINQYPDHFVWNFMNATLPYYGEGVSYFHTFDILYDAGNPTEDIYGPITMDDSYYWMNGYDGYFQAMHNRISGVSSIVAGTPEGLIVLKHWLHNHLSGSSVGGVANYYAGMPYAPYPLPDGTPEAGKHVQISFLQEATHALTIVGYNDSIRFDVNADGQFTNHLDITGDGIVDMKDWEIGGLKYVNSYGTDWGDSGFCYMLYRTLALKYGQGGIWNNSVHILHPDTAYSPLLTIKAKVQHNKRGRIRLTAGITSDTARYYPEHTLSFSVFNFQGLDYNMAGNNLLSGKTLELGLDISQLLSYVKPGNPSRIFLMIEEKDPDGAGSGLLLNYSVLDYTGPETAEFVSTDTPLAIVDNGKTIASVVTGTNADPLLIFPEGPVVVTPGIPASAGFSATGGYPPYTWAMKHVYTETDSSTAYPAPTGEIQIPSDPLNGFAAIPLPFSFPFYGKPYDTLYMHVNGYLMFDSQDMPYFYLLFDEPYLRQIKAIAGYMNKDMGIHSAGDFISVTSSQDKVTFSWRISSDDDNHYTNFSISIFPDGQITCHYGASYAEAGFLPVTGISNGSGAEIVYSSGSGKEIPEGRVYGYTPSRLPSGISLSENGLLSIPPSDEPFAGNLAIQVTDAHRLLKETLILATTGIEINIRPTDSLSVAAPGVSLPLDIEISNRSNQPFSNLALNLTAASANATITGELSDTPDLLAGETRILSDIFELIIADTVSSPQIARVCAILSSGGNTFRRFVEFPVDLPVVVISPPVIADGDNLTADPGEEAPMVFHIFNCGNASAGNLTATVSINDPFAAINGDCSVEIGELNGYSKTTISYITRFNQAAPQGREIMVNLNLQREEKKIYESNFPIVLGHTAIAIADMDKNHNSAIHIAEALKALNISSDKVETIDTSLINYDVIFLSLGFFSQNHRLTAFEDSLMVEYLDQGGKLYLEGGAFFKQDPATILRSRLGVEGSNLAWPAPADTLIGIAGTPAEGIQIDYRGDWKKGENLLPQPPAVPWFRDKNSALNFVVALDSGYYHTLASSVEFGGLFMFDSPGRPELMRRYLDFLGFSTTPLSVVFKPETTHICNGGTIGFEPFSSGTPISYQWTFEGGTPSTWDGPVPSIKYETPGLFTVSLTVNDGTASNTFTLDNLITVNNCTGIEAYQKDNFMLYPNPAAETISLANWPGNDRIKEVLITDLMGRVLLQKTFIDTGNISVPVSSLAPGLYIVVAKGETWEGSSKLVINRAACCQNH